MEILLALAGAVGLAVLLGQQQRPLPTAEEALAAANKLDQTPDDPSANLVVGKYEAFVLGDWKEGLSKLAKSQDVTLKALAEHELDPVHTASPIQKASMGDEWVLAAKKFPPLFRIFFDRASYWYIQAFDKVDVTLKAKLREQGQKLAAARPPGSVRKAMAAGWVAESDRALLDGSISHVGSFSVKLPFGDPKVPPGETFLRSLPVKIAGKKVEYSAWVRSEGTNLDTDIVFLNWFDVNGTLIGVNSVMIPFDLPFWNRVSAKMDVPPNAAVVKVGAAIRSKQGNAWIDDVSLKMDGKEMLKNPSFEER